MIRIMKLSKSQKDYLNNIILLNDYDFVCYIKRNMIDILNIIYEVTPIYSKYKVRKTLNNLNLNKKENIKKIRLFFKQITLNMSVNNALELLITNKFYNIHYDIKCYLFLITIILTICIVIFNNLLF